MIIDRALQKGFLSPLNPGNARSNGYLGMSMVGGCPTAAYDSYYGLRNEDMRLKWYGFSGRSYENGVRNLFKYSMNFTLVPTDHYMYHIEADFDSRYRGHADIILANQFDNELVVVDVKSLNWRKFADVKLYGRVPYSHEKNVCQVQAYMDHGNFNCGAIVYTPRDIPHHEWTDEFLSVDCGKVLPFEVVDVPIDVAAQIALNKQAKLLLELIDKKERPACTCGWCDPPREEEIPF